MPVDSVTFRAGPLVEALEERLAGNAVGAVARRDLGRYYDALAIALASVTLQPGQAGLLVDAMNGTIIDLFTAQLLPYEIEDSLADGLAKKWGVDGPALVAMIRDWSLLQRVAVCDAIERFWGDVYQIESTPARLVRVGLVREVQS